MSVYLLISNLLFHTSVPLYIFNKHQTHDHLHSLYCIFTGVKSIWVKNVCNKHTAPSPAHFSIIFLFYAHMHFIFHFVAFWPLTFLWLYIECNKNKRVWGCLLQFIVIYLMQPRHWNTYQEYYGNCITLSNKERRRRKEGIKVRDKLKAIAK